MVTITVKGTAQDVGFLNYGPLDILEFKGLTDPFAQFSRTF